MLAAYVHIPFCSRKCLYCGFSSTVYEASLADRYLEALDRELGLRMRLMGFPSVSSVYIGGGTPTVLSLHQLTTLFSSLRRHIALSPDSEITVEVNPESAVEGIYDLFKAMDVTRLSVGIQSFTDAFLRMLGRPHNAVQARESVLKAQSAGHRNINLDLIYALPDQQINDWAATLHEALSLAPQHLSVYCLTIEDRTPFARRVSSGNLLLPSQDVAADMYALAYDACSVAGLPRYELSNFALPGMQCRHNQHYWGRGEYAGFGAAAWSFVETRRWANLDDVKTYTNIVLGGGSPISYEERLSASQAAAEVVMLALRTESGLNLERFREAHGEAAHDALIASSRPCCASGHLKIEERHLRLSASGAMVANEILAMLMT